MLSASCASTSALVRCSAYHVVVSQPSLPWEAKRFPVSSRVLQGIQFKLTQHGADSKQDASPTVGSSP